MRKKIETSAGSSLLSYVFASIFGIAGFVIVGYGLVLLEAGSMQQFAISLALGGGFFAISICVFWAGIANDKKIAWLAENGTWITAKPIDVRTVSSDEHNRVILFSLILKPVNVEQNISGLANLEFESEPIRSRSISNNYKDKIYDVVVDPSAPADRYHVNINLQKVLS